MAKWLVDEMRTVERVVAGCRYKVRALVCPKCRGKVELAEGKLKCGCGFRGERLFELAASTD